MDRNTYLHLSPEEKLLLVIFGEKGEYHPCLSEVEGVSLRQAIEDALLTLKHPRYKKIIQLRFGFEDGRSHTLAEVGKEFNVTKERIRQIEAQAVRQLRHPTRRRLLKQYLQ